MRFYAYIGDDAAFLTAYEQLKVEQAKLELPNPLIEPLRLVMTEADDRPDPSKRLDLAPIEISRPTGDDVPDSDDTSAFGVWPHNQLES